MAVKMNYLGNFRGASTMKDQKDFVSECLNIWNKLKFFKILSLTNEIEIESSNNRLIIV